MKVQEGESHVLANGMEAMTSSSEERGLHHASSVQATQVHSITTAVDPDGPLQLDQGGSGDLMPSG